MQQLVEGESGGGFQCPVRRRPSVEGEAVLEEQGEGGNGQEAGDDIAQLPQAELGEGGRDQRQGQQSPHGTPLGER